VNLFKGVSGKGILFMQNQENEPTHEQIMDYYYQADLLISNGYPVKTTDCYELAKIIANKKLKKNEKTEDCRNT